VRLPPARVVEAWGIDHAAPLEGGEGQAFVADDLVLKPVVDVRQAVWLAEVLESLPEPEDLRIIRPVASHSGTWVIDGWSAWRRLEGRHIRGRWQEVLGVADRFHSAVRGVAWSDAIECDNAWTQADRFAWDEQNIEVPRPLRPLVDTLLSRRVELDLPSQLIHGDLTDNVLFHDRLPPAVIDISPYWRPARFAQAVVIADSVAWFGADVETAEGFIDPEGVQLLVRAMLFRLGAAVALCGDDPTRLECEARAYQRLLTLFVGQV
jgi:uncharacterized protein (TIGR02569 family)